MASAPQLITANVTDIQAKVKFPAANAEQHSINTAATAILLTASSDTSFGLDNHGPNREHLLFMVMGHLKNMPAGQFLQDIHHDTSLQNLLLVLIVLVSYFYECFQAMWGDPEMEIWLLSLGE